VELPEVVEVELREVAAVQEVAAVAAEEEDNDTSTGQTKKAV